MDCVGPLCHGNLQTVNSIVIVTCWMIYLDVEDPGGACMVVVVLFMFVVIIVRQLHL